MRLSTIFEQRDPDWDYDTYRQQEIDDKIDQTLVTRHVVRIDNKVVAGPFDDYSKAVRICNNLNKQHLRSNDTYKDCASVYTYRTNTEIK